jgi:hypothetical protein
LLGDFPRDGEANSVPRIPFARSEGILCATLCRADER